MDEILSEIYQGNFCVPERRKNSSQPEAWARMTQLEEELRARIPDDLKPLLEKYIDAREQLTFSACEDDFIAGYKLGTRLTAAGFAE